MDPMQILSKIYEVMGQSTPEDLFEAAALAGDRRLSRSLEMLANYKHSAVREKGMYFKNAQGRPRVIRSSTTDEKPQTKAKVSSVPNLESKPKNRDQAYTKNGLGAKLSEVVLSKKYFKTNRQLIDYLEKVNLPFKVTPKYSRTQTLNSLIKWIEKLPPESQRQIFRKLLRIVPKSETAGWFDAIRSK